ncbi:hypothetical protein B0H66DRAFT_477050 [Apodospora peruviana]|uniref:Zn(2)-C6 fungal-type domain-containing protein n=1 Tax=Apodospora peruviana TaxID=516989 RepID=A0AAE0I3X5_9PEZI|nr:hypothetical protein B0H66DRAFT_477050 [Apodospora peruviana]
MSSGLYPAAANTAATLINTTAAPHFLNFHPVQPIGGRYDIPSDPFFSVQTNQQWSVPGPSVSRDLYSFSPPRDRDLNSPLSPVPVTIFHEPEAARLSSVDSGHISAAESHYAPSPASAPSRGRRASTVSTDITVPDHASPLPPTPVPQKKKPKASAKSFEFVHVKPSLQAGENGSKKRPAEDEPAGPAQTLSQVSMEGEDGEVQGTMTTFGNRPKKRAPFTPEKKAQTKKVRDSGGVCTRCKKAKKRCNLFLLDNQYQACDLCATTLLYKGKLPMPCFQSQLEDILFFRKGPAENEPLFTQRWTIFDLKDISKVEVPLKTLTLTQHIGHHRLTVYASEFEPQDGDVLSYKWTDREGNRKEMKMPHYSLTAIERVTMNFAHYINRAKYAYFDSVRDEDDLAWLTVSTAMKYAKSRPGSLVDVALDLWAICRMIEIPWKICGQETLGIERVTDELNPHCGHIPIPPTMDTHLDQVVIKKVLHPLRDRLIKRFQKNIAPPTPEAWFETYLAAFVLLNHIEYLAKHSVSHAKLHTLPGKFSNIPFLEGAFHGAKIILSRFHFVCSGAAPFKMDWSSPEAIKMAKLDQEQVAFMKRTQDLVKAKQNDAFVLRRKHKYESPLYWCYQLYSEDWDKSPAHVIEEEDEE